MRTTARSRIARTGVAGLFAISAALGLAGCAGDEPATDSANGDTATDAQTEPTDTEPTDGEAADDEPEGDAVDVAAIQDEGAGSDGVYDGLYDNDFRNELTSFDGERVTVSAEVNEIISEQAFTLGGIDNPDVEPLLVIHRNPIGFLQPGTPVLVTGVVHKAYNVAVAEEQLGMQLEEVDFADWESQPYIETDTVGELSAEH